MKNLNLFKTILFNEVMVKAILSFLKTNTRRVIEGISSEATFKYLGIDKTKGSPTYGRFGALFELPKREWFDDKHPMLKFVAAPYAIGDILWVREPARVTDYDGDKMAYCFNGENESKVIRIPNRFLRDIGFGDMSYPTWIVNCQGVPNGCIKEMARTFLRVKEIRVEKLQDISEQDIRDEGIDDNYLTWWISESGNGRALMYPHDGFKKLWNSINGKGAYEKNPFVWVIVFEIVKRPENFLQGVSK